MVAVKYDNMFASLVVPTNPWRVIKRNFYICWFPWLLIPCTTMQFLIYSCGHPLKCIQLILMYTASIIEQIFQRCPDGNADFRTEQCKTFGEELMSFTNESDPCKLLCSSPGENPVLKRLVVDGTPCSSSGVCVDGQCVVSYEKYNWLLSCWILCSLLAVMVFLDQRKHLTSVEHAVICVFNFHVNLRKLLLMVCEM